MVSLALSLQNDLTTGPVGKRLWMFAFPFMLSNACQALYSLVDMIVVGQAVGTAGLAAVSNGSQLTHMFLNIGIGFSVGGQIYIAQLCGAGNRGKLKRVIGTMFTAIAALSLILTVFGLMFAGELIALVHTPAEAVSGAVVYLVVCSAGMFFSYGYNAVCAVLRGMGDSHHPFVFVVLASAVNVVLDLLFVFPMGMGVFGAALATVIGQAVSFLYAMGFLYRRRDEFDFDFSPRSFVPDGESLSMLLKLGLPMALQNNVISISMVYISSLVNGFGLVANAVYGVGTKLYSIVSIVSQSVQSAGCALIGQNMGAGKPDRVRDAVWWAWAGSLVMMVFIALGCFVFPVQVFSVFDRSAEVLAMAPRYMHIAFFMLFAFVLMSPPLALMQGVGAMTLSMTVAMLDGAVVRIPLCLFLCYHTSLGLYGVFWGNSLAAWVSVILGALYFFSGAWKKRVPQASPGNSDALGQES